VSTPKSRSALQHSLSEFVSQPLQSAALGFWSALGYESQKRAPTDGTPKAFMKAVGDALDTKAAHFDLWKQAHILFQLADDDVAALSRGQLSFSTQQGVLFGSIESFLFVAVELVADDQKRNTLADISRALNKLFKMPVIIMFKHGKHLSLATVGRRTNKRDSSRDVLEKVTLVKDVRIQNPHRAHIEILADLALAEISQFADYKKKPESFADLFTLWQRALSASLLNKRFYNDLAYWYTWACGQVTFPKGAPANEMNVIRLITRLMFIWFIKEKGLVREELFDPAALTKLLALAPDKHPDDSGYYKAILQNLFFATLNTNPEESTRQFRERKAGEQSNDQYLVHTVFRYKALFNGEAANEALEIFRTIPYLNGGLFECLDREIDADELDRPGIKGKTIAESRRNKAVQVLRVDGFSERPESEDNKLVVPNKLFFGGELETLDLSASYGAGAKKARIKGLIDIFNHYKFTVDEHTPLEEEVALDPELLGHVFENLLASVNPDTESSARKASGSFYTPRVVVDYMVDEALVAYFAHKLQPHNAKKSLGQPQQDFLRLGSAPGELDLEETSSESSAVAAPDTSALEARLRELLSYTEEKHWFHDKAERRMLISAIDTLRALDPACGSGAFPMGLLQKLVHILKKLDPDNALWKEQQLAPLHAQHAAALKNPDANARREQVERVNADMERLEARFSDANYPDYSRKLYLIEKCLFGVDIQPIAVQIAKLRFFISLIVSQKLDATKDNWNINPLPNLETKLVAANSLIGVARQTGLSMHEPEIKILRDELRQGRADHFALRTYKGKRAWRKRDKVLRRQLSALLEQDGYGNDDAVRLAAWDPYDQNAKADFFDADSMFLQGENFDLLIGNPPYVRHELIQELKPIFKDQYDCYTGTADLYVYFYERSIKLLKPHGAFAFITSNKWYRAKYGSDLRRFMAQETLLKSIVDFGDAPVFDALAYPTIVIATRREKTTSHPTESLQVLNWTGVFADEPVEQFPTLVQAAGFRMPQSGLTVDGWRLEPAAQRDLLARLRKAGKPLGNYVQGKFYNGIKTGLNEAFVISGQKRAELIAEHSSSADIIKPFLRGRDVKRWKVEFAEWYLIKIQSSENFGHPWSGEPAQKAEKIFAKTYPAIFRYFQSLRESLIARYDQGEYFWELRSCDYWDKFEKPKLIIAAITERPTSAIDDEEFFCNNKASICVFDSLIDASFCQSILSSPTSTWLAQQTFATKEGGFYDFDPRYSTQFIIPNAGTTQKYQMHLLANSLRFLLEREEVKSAVPHGSDAGIVAFIEQLLNGLVYELFFTNELHERRIRLFDALGKSELPDIVAMPADQARNAIATIHEALSRASHPVRGMLFDLQGLPIVQMIEGHD
jgi:adenine-specific DNA-methyltransferase